MPAAKKPARKARIKVRDLKARKNPKGGGLTGGGKAVKIQF